METFYSLDNADLASADNLTQANKDVVIKSCEKALRSQYGQNSGLAKRTEGSPLSDDMGKGHCSGSGHGGGGERSVVGQLRNELINCFFQLR